MLLSDVRVTLTQGPEPEPAPAEKSKEEILAILDGEIEQFSQYMSQIDSPARGALSHPERALLKTYLVAKLRERL